MCDYCNIDYSPHKYDTWLRMIDHYKGKCFISCSKIHCRLDMCNAISNYEYDTKRYKHYCIVGSSLSNNLLIQRKNGTYTYAYIETQDFPVNILQWPFLDCRNATTESFPKLKVLCRFYHGNQFLEKMILFRDLIRINLHVPIIQILYHTIEIEPNDLTCSYNDITIDQTNVISQYKKINLRLRRFCFFNNKAIRIILISYYNFDSTSNSKCNKKITCSHNGNGIFSLLNYDVMQIIFNYYYM